MRLITVRYSHPLQLRIFNKSVKMILVNGFLSMFAGSWEYYEDELAKENVTMTKTNDDLFGKIWTARRPAEPNSPINALPYKCSGIF